MLSKSKAKRRLAAWLMGAAGLAALGLGQAFAESLKTHAACEAP